MSDTDIPANTIRVTLHAGTDAARIVLTITPEGKFVLGPGATMDEAALAFVDACERFWQDVHDGSDDWKSASPENGKP